MEIGKGQLTVDLNSQEGGYAMLTKRQLLQYIGSVAGAAGVYRSMAALGMLGVSSLTGCTSASSQGPGDGKRVVILGAGIA